MKLADYPAAIEAAQLDANAISQRINDYRRALATLTDAITFDVCFAINPDTQKPLFTNEQQRATAIREKQRDHEGFQSLEKNIEAAEQAKAAANARLERLRWEIKVGIVERQFEMEQFTARQDQRGI